MLACSLFKVFFNRKFKSHDAWSIRSSFDREKLVFSIFLKPKNSPFRDRNLVAPPKLKLRQKRNINEFIQACSCFFNRNRMTRIQFDVLLIAKSTFFRYFRNRKFSRFRNRNLNASRRSNYVGNATYINLCICVVVFSM